MKTMICFLLAVTACRGAVVIDNLNSTTNGFSTGLTGPTAGIPPFFSIPNHQTAFSFTTGPAADGLVSVQVAITVANNSSAIAATLSTGSAVPGGGSPVSLGSVTPSATSGSTTITFTPGAAVPLAANTEYWVHLTVPAGGGYYGVLHAEGPAEALGFELGSSWQFTPSGGWVDISPQVRARITTEAVIPEPGVTLAGGLGVLLLFRRRRH